MVNQELTRETCIESGGMLHSAVIRQAEEEKPIVFACIYAEKLDKIGFRGPREVWTTYLMVRFGRYFEN